MDVLVDILLSLLGRAGDALPFHPLREACEALFRAFAEQVTPQGFEDLIRVVQQTSEGTKEEEDEEVFEDEEEDGDEAMQGSHTQGTATGSKPFCSVQVRHDDIRLLVLDKCITKRA